MACEEKIQEMIGRFRRKMEGDPAARAEVEPIRKAVNIDLGSERYSFVLDHAEILDFKPGLLDAADITLTTTPESLTALVDGDLRPMRAYVTKKIAIKGSIQDLMHLKKLF